MRKFARQPETEKEADVSTLPEVANDHDIPSAETAAAFRAANDKDTLRTAEPFRVPDAANDDVAESAGSSLQEYSVQEADAIKVRAVRERLQLSTEPKMASEAMLAEPLEEAEVPKNAAEYVAQPEAPAQPPESQPAEPAPVQPQAAAAATPAGTTGGGTGGGSTSSHIAVPSTAFSGAGGKLWGFVKGVGKFLGFLTFAPIAAAFKLMHYGADRIMKFAGAEGAKNSGKK